MPHPPGSSGTPAQGVDGPNLAARFAKRGQGRGGRRLSRRRPLTPVQRAYFEPRFRRDFSTRPHPHGRCHRGRRGSHWSTRLCAGKRHRLRRWRIRTRNGGWQAAGGPRARACGAGRRRDSPGAEGRRPQRGKAIGRNQVHGQGPACLSAVRRPVERHLRAEAYGQAEERVQAQRQRRRGDLEPDLRGRPRRSLARRKCVVRRLPRGLDEARQGDPQDLRQRQFLSRSVRPLRGPQSRQLSRFRPVQEPAQDRMRQAWFPFTRWRKRSSRRCRR